MDFVTDNWTVIAPLIVAAIGLFWPQIKPIIGPIVDPKPGPSPDPNPSPTPRPGVSLALQLAMALLQAMIDAKNQEGIKLAKEAAKSAVDKEHEVAQ